MKACPPEDEIIAFATGSLGAKGRAAFEHHIDTCPACAGLVAVAARSDEHDLTRHSNPVGAPELELVADHPELERYVVLRELGVGGMGRVYLAFDHRLNRQVALKLVLDRKDGRVLREAQAAASLRHPSVVTVHEAGSTGAVAYIVMEYVAGGTLRRWLEEARPWRDIVAKFLAVGEGLAAAHEAGLLHRDFKPDNVLLDDKGRPKVADFGLARAWDAAPIPSESHNALLSLDMTATGAVMGTPAYMAPEQHAGTTVGPAADQYAFCTALYEALFGERPYSGKDVATLARAKQAGPSTIRPPSSRAVPGWLTKAVLRGLRRRPEERFESMRALLEVLADRPWRRRLAIVGAAAAASVCVGLVGVQIQQERARVAECHELGAAVFDSWNPQRAGRLHAVFADMPQAFAVGSFELGRGRMSAYAVRYSLLRTESCLGRAERSPELQAVADRCFEQALDGVEKLVGDWEEPNQSVVESAAGAPLSLRRLDDCVAKEALERRLVAAASRGSDDRVDVVRATYRDARQRVGAGDLERGAAEAKAAVREAETLGAYGLASAAGLTLCDAYRRENKADEARLACQRSYQNAVVGNDHEGAFHTGCALASLEGVAGNAPLADLWLALAESHLTHLVDGNETDHNTARLAMARGYLATDSGKHEEALEFYVSSGEQYDEVQGEGSLFAGYAWLSAAHAASLLGKTEVALEAAQAALERRSTVYGEMHPLTVEARHYVAGFRYASSPERGEQEFSTLADRVEAFYGPRGPHIATVYAEWSLAAHAAAGCDLSLTPALEAVERTTEESRWLPEALTTIAECSVASDPDAARAALHRVLAMPEGSQVNPRMQKRLAQVEEALAGPTPSPEG